MYWFYVLLYVLLNLIICEIFESSVVQSLWFFWCFQYQTLTTERPSCLRLTLLIHLKTLISSFFLRLLHFVVAVDVKHIDNRVSPSHEVRVVSIDVAFLHLNQGSDHIGGIAHLLRQ